MKQQILILVLLFSVTLAKAADDVTLTYRKLFEKSASSETSATTLYTSTRQYSTTSKSLYLGYKGVAEIMLCNYTGNVYKKVSYFNSGKKNLELSIAQDPSNIELKFLRFCIQKNTPSFLGYNDNIKSDEAEINRYIVAINSDPALVSFIKTNKANIK